MDRVEAHKLNKSHLFKRTLQLVVWISMFSVFVCYSSSFCMIPHPFNVYFSTFLFSFLTRTLERKYMFLICNGILVFLGKTSLSCTSSSSSLSSESNEVKSFADEELVILENGIKSSKELSLDQEQEEEQEAQEDQEKRRLSKQKDALEEDRRNVVSAEQEIEEKQETRDEVTTQEAILVPTAVNEDLMSTDEMNKKFEEFIRKMKEEIRIEAQQQLIAAV